ncbi:MAG: glycosyltransferase [Deltaproteobacteria bacterium]|nr:glycosyltransferase [Deltaproteobacteria bacterium]
MYDDIQEKIALIIPCFNEEKRLHLDKFNLFHQNVYFLFVDDGSVDNTAKLITENLPSNSFFIKLNRNRGKAEAVRQGVFYLKNMSLYEELSWIGYWDADLSTPLEAIFELLIFRTFYSGEIYGVFGSRICKLGSEITRLYIRHLLGRLVATFAALLLRVKSYDSQCGAKLFRKEIIGLAFDHPFISIWLFDLEIILRLNNYRIVECPLKKWQHVKGSKLNFFKDTHRVLIDLFRIRNEYVKNINGF